VSARHQGNLFITDELGRDTALAGLRLQQELGCDVEWVERSEVVRRWPTFEGPGYVGATFGPRDGSVDPSAVVQGYRRKAIELGARFESAAVDSLIRLEDRVVGVTLADGEAATAATVIVCAGAWSTGLLSAVGIDLPVVPMMRSVFVVGTDFEATADLPSAFQPSGLYVLPEHEGTFLVSWSQEDDPIGFDFSVQRSRFYDRIWPELVAGFPAFERLEVVRSWAGLYAVNTLDGNAVLGRWPDVSGVLVCTGFSGHGFQQCHAVGRYLAETVVDHPHELDLSRLGTDRVLRGEPLLEHAGRLI
jgi:glycine/D-amino acid oxidase-like deaminating enzyme